MPRNGYTSITVPIKLKNGLKGASCILGFSSVPRMLESWMVERTGTVQVRDGAIGLSPMTDEPIDILNPFAESRRNARSGDWCGRRDSDPGRLRGRQMTARATALAEAVLSYRRNVALSRSLGSLALSSHLS